MPVAGNDAMSVKYNSDFSCVQALKWIKNYEGLCLLMEDEQ